MRHRYCKTLLKTLLLPALLLIAVPAAAEEEPDQRPPEEVVEDARLEAEYNRQFEEDSVLVYEFLKDEAKVKACKIEQPPAPEGDANMVKGRLHLYFQETKRKIAECEKLQSEIEKLKQSTDQGKKAENSKK